MDSSTGAIGQIIEAMNEQKWIHATPHFTSLNKLPPEMLIDYPSTNPKDIYEASAPHDAEVREIEDFEEKSE